MGIDHIIGYQLVQTSLVTGANFERAVGKAFKLRPVEFTILQLVRETPHISPTQLAKILVMTTPSMTAWVDKLVKRKYLLREKNAQDGRAQKLLLTAQGVAVVDQALALLLESEAALLAHLSLGERTLLLEILHKIREPELHQADSHSFTKLTRPKP
jgi:DNA-binding MarR family transcriptional regulator